MTQPLPELASVGLEFIVMLLLVCIIITLIGVSVILLKALLELLDNLFR